MTTQSEQSCQVDALDPIEFRAHPFLRWVFVVFAPFFLVMAVWSVAVFLTDSEHPAEDRIGPALFFGGSWLILLTVCVAMAIAMHRVRVQIRTDGIEKVGVFSRCFTPWEDVTRLVMEWSDELSYGKLTMSRVLEGWVFDEAACAPDDVQRVASFVSSLPPGTGPAFEVIDIPNLKKRVIWFVITLALTMAFGQGFLWVFRHFQD